MRSEGLWERLREAVLSPATHPLAVFPCHISLLRPRVIWIVFNRFRNTRILGLQPRDQATMLGVKTIEFFVEEFSWKKSLVPRGAKLWISSRTIVNLIRVFHLINSYNEIVAFKNKTLASHRCLDIRWKTPSHVGYITSKKDTYLWYSFSPTFC